MTRSTSRPVANPLVTTVTAVVACALVVLAFVTGKVLYQGCETSNHASMRVNAVYQADPCKGLSWEQRVQCNRAQLSEEDWAWLKAQGFVEPVAVIHLPEPTPED